MPKNRTEKGFIAAHICTLDVSIIICVIDRR